MKYGFMLVQSNSADITGNKGAAELNNPELGSSS
jgi:hypothetical protein